MTIVRELVTKLSFKLDDTVLSEYSKKINDVQRQAKTLMGTFQASSFGQGLKSLQNVIQPKPQVSFEKNSIGEISGLQLKSATERIKQLSEYSDELKGLSSSERKDVLELNRIEKKAIREVAAEQRKLAAEKRKNNVFEKTNLFEGLKGLNRLAQRSLVGILTASTASFGFSYKDYKNYANNKKDGKIVKTSLTSDQIKQFERFDKVAVNFKETIATLRNAFSVALLPAITTVLKTFNEWYRLNKKIIDGKLKNFAVQLGDAFKTISGAFSKIMPTVSNVINAFGGLENVILGLIGVKLGAWAAAVVGFLGTPIGQISSLIGAFYLLYDEIKTTLAGGESYLSDFSNYVNKWATNIIDKFKKMSDAMIDWLGIRSVVDAHNLKNQQRQDTVNLTKQKNPTQAQSYFNRGELNNVTTSMPTFNPGNSEFIQKMAFSKNNNNVVNNITGGGVTISINNTGNIDNDAIKKLGKELNTQFDQKINDIFSFAIPMVIN